MKNQGLTASASALILLPLVLGCNQRLSNAPSAGIETEESSSVSQPSGPYVRVLGTVQDGGLPHAACTCDRCEMARRDPDTKRFVSSIALILPSTNEVFLFDATPDLHQQLVALRDVRVPPTGKVDRSPVDGVFLTHAHIGHYLGLAFFGYEAVSTSGLKVIATPRMSEFLNRNGPWSQLVEIKNIVLDEIEPGQTYRIADSVTVEAFSAPHRDEYADTLGFILRGPSRSLLYLPDTDSWVAWDFSVEDFLAQVDVALVDGTFYSTDELPGRSVDMIGHPLISTSMDLLQDLVDSSQTEVFFTHLNHSNTALDPDSEAAHDIRDRGFGVLAEGDRFDL